MEYRIIRSPLIEKVEEAVEVKILSNGIKYEPGNVPPWKLPRSCDKCGKEFRSKGHLQRHVEGVHHKFKGYKCDRCDYEATDRRYVERHKAIVHENQRLPAIFDLIKRGPWPP